MIAACLKWGPAAVLAILLITTVPAGYVGVAWHRPTRVSEASVTGGGFGNGGANGQVDGGGEMEGGGEPNGHPQSSPAAAQPGSGLMGPTQARKWPDSPVFLAEPLQRTLDNDTLAEVLEMVSNSEREVIFTTFREGPPPADESPLTAVLNSPGPPFGTFTANWVGSLLRSGVSHMLLIGADAYSCDRFHDWGDYPCYIDGFNDSRSLEFAAGYAVFLKWLYIAKILESGYNAIFSDNDVTFKADPFQYWNTDYELQGLHDVGGEDQESPMVPSFLEFARCPIAGLYEGSHWPCMSTGLMYFRDTDSTRALSRGMAQHMREDPLHWEQRMFQWKVVPYLITLGDGPRGIRLRLLPTEMFHNVFALEGRLKAGMPVHTVAVHSGYIHGTVDKSAALSRVDAWNPFTLKAWSNGRHLEAEGQPD